MMVDETMGLSGHIVEYIEKMDDLHLARKKEIKEYIRGTLGVVLRAAQPRWLTPDDHMPQEKSLVAFVTEGCKFSIGVYGHDDILGRTVWSDTNGSAFTDAQVHLWMPLPALPPGDPCEAGVLGEP